MHQCNDCGQVFNPGQSEDSISPAVQCEHCSGYNTKPYRDQPSPTQSDMSPRDMPDAGGGDDTGGNPLQEGILGDYQNRGVRDESFASSYKISLFETPEFATESLLLPSDLYGQALDTERAHRAEVQVPHGITDNLHAALGNLGAWVGNPQENGQLRPYKDYWQTIRPTSMKPGSIQIGVADPLMGEIINHVADNDDLTPLHEYRGRASHTRTAGPAAALAGEVAGDVAGASGVGGVMQKVLGGPLAYADDLLGMGGNSGGQQQQQQGGPVQDVSYYARVGASEDDLFPDSHNEIPKHEDGDHAQQDDGNSHEWQRDLSVDEDGGGSSGAPSFDNAGPGMQRFKALLPLLLQIIESGEDGSADPLVQGLHEALDAEIPGYLDHADDNAANELILMLQGEPEDEGGVANDPDHGHNDENAGGIKEAGMQELTQIAELRRGLPMDVQHTIDQLLTSEGPTSALNFLLERGATPPQPQVGSGIDLGGPDDGMMGGVWASVHIGDTAGGDFLPDLTVELPFPRLAAGPMDPMGSPIGPPPGPPGAMGGPPSPPPPPAAPSPGDNQGPVTDEQQAWFSHWLQEHGRDDEVQTMLQDPALYAKEFARARGREVPPEGPQDGLSAEPPMPAQEEAPPGDTMPVPGMQTGPGQMMSAVNKYSADSAASQCPNCQGHTTETLDEEGNCRCHGCGEMFKTDGKTLNTLTNSSNTTVINPYQATTASNTAPYTVTWNGPNTASTWNVDEDPAPGATAQLTAASDTHTFDFGSLGEDDSAPQGVPAADRYQQEDHREEQDSGHTWTDADGNPLKVGSSYEMYSKKYDIPDLVRIEAVKPSVVNYTITGEYGLHHSTELSKQEASLEGLSFKPADTIASLGLDDGIEENNDDNTGYTGSPEHTDLSAPHGMVAASVNPQLDWLSEDGFGTPHTAGADYTPMEQRALIDEQGSARNHDLLDLANTHYIQDAEEDQFLFGL